MRYTNLHTHTNFSDGAHSVAENVASAVNKNMLSLGFSDHSYTPCDPLYCMKPEQYEPYLRTLEAAKKECSQQKTPEGKRPVRDTPERSEQ